MPDPALLHVLQQINYQPPAIIEPAAGLDGGPISYAYDFMMAEKDREFEAWLAKGPAMRATLYDAIKTRPEGFTVDMVSAVVEPFRKKVTREARITARLWESERRHPTTDPLQRRVVTWLYDRQRRHYEAAEDLIHFLCAMRAEIDPESRTGPTFDDPDELERYLLVNAA